MESHIESQDSNKEDIINETQNVNESQDFHLVVTESDDFLQLDKSESNPGSMKPPETTKENKLITQSDSQESLDILQSQCKIHDNSINIKEKQDDQNKKAIRKDYKMIEDNVYSSMHEYKDEFHDNDEDEVIEGTPPHLYSSPKSAKKAVIATEFKTLKRKAGFSDERPAKIVKTSIDATLDINKRFLKEESQSSCKFDDSSEELSKNSGKNVIIEETPDLQVNEFSQDFSNNLAKDTGAIENSAIQEHSFEQQNKTIPEKSCDISMKLIETSTDDSIITINSLYESNIQMEGSNLSMETKENINLSNAIVIVDEKSETDIPNTTNGSLQLKDADTASNENNKIQTNSTENKKTTGKDSKYHEQEISSHKQLYNEDCSKNTGSCKSRMSVEVIYDRKEKTAICESKSKPELVEIDEEGEKIIIDSLDEDLELRDSKNIKDSLDSKSDNKLTNGSTESKRDDTISVESDIFFNTDISSALERGNNNPTASIHGAKGSNIKGNSFVSKDLDNIDFISISDNENDISNMEDSIKNKSDLIHSSIKATQIEKEIGVCVRLKCLLHIDENTKELLSKELTAVHCESNMDIYQKKYDTSSWLADISDNNKESSPGSVNSNPQLYHLNPSNRLSILSMVSSSSSASSAASLAAKLAIKDSMHFSLPRGPVKHAKKLAQDTTPIKDKQTLDEDHHRLTYEWKNNHLLTTTILNYVNAELGAIDTYNINNEKLNDDHLQKVRSSTPEIVTKKAKLGTLKSTKKGKTLKRPRSKITKLNVQNNKAENVNIPQALDSTQIDNTPSRKKSKLEMEENKLLVSNVDILINSSTQDELIGELISKEVFARWSDNNYYPGIVADKIKTKYKIDFYDGKSKVLIPEFIIPVPKTLKEGLSVYATTKVDDYGSCGIIVDIQTITNNVYYIVETDEGERLRVQMKNIFLSSDQAQLLKEEIYSKNNETFPTTPKQLGQVTLDNMVEGKRRSKRIGTPIFSTPKSSARNSNVEPSVSGVSAKLKKKKNTLSENEGISSDSNISVKDENINGVQNDIIGTPYEQIAKGPQSKIKGKPRSKRKVEDEQTIIRLGPIPQANSNIFKGMHFILAYVLLDTLDKYQNLKTASDMEIETDNETENEDYWIDLPFVRDRLRTQIIEGGGKIYTDFDQIPKDEYKNTKLITNVPNTTANSLLCLSVGMRAYNHKWIIRCCLEGKILNPAEYVLPIGWSLQRRLYIDRYEKEVGTLLMKTLIIIPNAAFDGEFTTFWRRVCENVGAIVLEAENAGIMETLDFDNDIKIVIVSNRRCPSWAVKKATELKIPLLSTTWVTQCLIEGKRCDEGQHPRYNFK